MIDTGKHKEIVVTCSCYVNQDLVLSHASTFLRQETSDGDFKTIICYDPNENHFFEKGGHPINYLRLFGRYKIITILALDGRPVKNAAEKD